MTFAETLVGRVGWRLDRHYSVPPIYRIADRVRY